MSNYLNKLPSVLIIFFLIALPSFLHSQITINSFEPSEIVVCGDTVSYDIEIINGGTGLISSPNISIQFPEGVTYIPGSLIGTGSSESDISNLNLPVFDLSNLAVGRSLSFNVSIKAGCSSLSSTSSFSNEYNLTYGGNTEFYESPPYNILIPSIAIASTINDDFTGSVRDIYTRSFTIANTGFGAVDSLIFVDNFPAGLTILNTSVGNITITGNQAQIWLTAADFQNIGDGDIFFESGEEIIIEEEIEITDCEVGTSSLSVSWGCDGNICRDFLFFAETSVSGEPPALSASFGRTQNASFCTEGEVNMTVENTAPNVAGATAFNIILEPGIGNVAESEIIGRNLCYTLNDFLINGVAVTFDTTNFAGYGLDLSQLTSDPDGPGGLSDLDGDGQFDDLAPGETFDISFHTLYDVACLECETASLPQVPVRMGQIYKNECGASYFDIENSDTYKQNIGIATIEDNVQFEYFSGDTALFSFSFKKQIQSFVNGCQNPETTIKLKIPQLISFTDFTPPTFNDLPVNYNLSNDTLTLDFAGLPNGDMDVYFLISCDSALLSSNQPCQLTGTTPTVNVLEYNVEFKCSDTGCNDPVTIFCGSTVPFFASCQSGSTPSSAVNVFDFSATRTTLGWADTTLTTLVSPTDSSLNLNTGMSFDIVRFDISAVAIGTGNFNSSKLRIFHFPEGNNSVFTYIRDEFTFFDSETSQIINCKDTSTNVSSEELYLGLFAADIELEKHFTSGCLSGLNFTDGDTIKYSVYVKLEHAALPAKLSNLKGLSAGIVFEDGGESLLCSKRRFPFQILRALSIFKLDRDANFRNCDNITITANLRQGANNSVDSDPFPNEIRPVSDFDSIVIKLPVGANLIPNSSRILYEHLDAGSQIATSSFALNEPEITQADSSIYLKYRNTNFPVVDFITGLTQNQLTFDLASDCRIKSDFSISAEASYKLFTYPSFLDAPRSVSIVDERSIRSTPPRKKLSVSSQSFVKNTNRVFWDIEICNNSNDSLTQISENWIAAEIEGQNLNLFSLFDITDPAAPRPIFLSPFGSKNDKWGKVGAISGTECRTYRLTAEYNDCIIDSVLIKSGFDCSGYPVDPLIGYQTPAPVGSLPASYSCEDNVDENSVVLIPRNPEFQFELLKEPADLSNLCEPLTYEVRILNTQTGPAFDMNVAISFPPGAGMTIVPGSTEFQYPADEPFQSAGDPVNTPGTNDFIWDISAFNQVLNDRGLTGTFDQPLNEIILRFQVTTNCDFLPGFAPSLTTSGNGVCLGQVVSSPFSLPVLSFDGFTPDNSYQLDLLTGQINPCSDSGDMTIEIENTSSDPSSLGQTVQIIIPDELQYISGTVVGIQNFPSNIEPDISFFNNKQILQWEIPTDLLPGETASFRIAYESTRNDKLACGLSEAIIRTTQRVTIPCATAPQGSCPISVINEQANFKLEIVYAEPGFTSASANSVPANDSMEMVNFNYEIVNNSVDILFDSSAMITIFADTNGDELFDGATDKFLNKFSTPNVTVSPLSSVDTSASILLPGKDLCGLFLVLDDSQNACICSSDTIYIPMIPIDNAIEDDTICFGKSVNLGNLPLIGHQYSWEPAGFFPTNLSNPEFSFQGTLPNDNRVTDTFILTTTRLAGCSVTDTVNITTYQNPSELAVSDYNGSPISCFGADDAFITASVDALQPLVDTTWNSGQTTAFIDDLSPGNYTVTFMDVLGCKTEKSIEITEPDSLGNNLVQSDFQGFGIRCFGQNSGFAQANVFGGTGNYSYEWSNGADSAQITNLSAGIYSVIVRDANNCTDIRDFELIEPEDISAMAETVGSPCFGEDNGIIEVVDVRPVGDYTFAIDCQNYTPSPLFLDLEEGVYDVCIKDDRGCIKEETFVIDAAPELLIDLTGDTTIFVGDSVALLVQTSYPVNQFVWEPPIDLSCVDCPNPISKPEITQYYIVTAIDDNGCEVSERVTVAINKQGRIYVPTAFSPNGDGTNDLLQVYSGYEIAKIKSFNIYSRWGEKVFEAKDYDPNTTQIGWDGRLNGKDMNPNIFTYYVEAEIGDGTIIFEKGEFQLIR